MHQISKNCIWLAEQHTVATYRHGLLLVALGKSLKQDSNFCTQECGQFIHKQGLLVQEHARSSLTYMEQLSTCGFSSTELYLKAAAARSKAIILYTEAVTIYTQILQARHRAARIRLQLPDRQDIYYTFN